MIVDHNRGYHGCLFPVVGFAGPMRVGKTTAKDFACTAAGFRAATYAFAKPLKEIATSMGWDGVKDKRGRRLLQRLGTDCGRECISEDVWADMGYAQMSTMQTRPIFVDDVRFDNEVDRIHALHGVVVYIRPRLRRRIWLWVKRMLRLSHASERPIKNPDFVFDNTGSLKDLRDTVIKDLFHHDAE